MKRLTLISIGLFVGLAVTMLACNLSSPQPPTLVPRATATPMPTIGYATLSPDELPVQATPLPPSNAAVLNLINQVDAQRLEQHVQTLQNMGTRHINSAYTVPNTGIGGARDYLVQQFQAIASQSQGRFQLIPHTFPVSWEGVDSSAENVVGFLSGRETGAGVILIGAHYDSISYSGGTSDGNSYAPGANDNGSGVATILEIARVMSLMPQPPRATVIFALFSAEEIGRVGSKAFVTDYIQHYDLPLTAMINLDIVGSSTGPDGSINDHALRLYSEGPNESPSRQLARALNLIAYNYLPDFSLDMQDAVDREGRYSDHMSFNEAGYPAIRFIEADEDINRQHTERDTSDDVQIPYLTRVTQTVLTLTVALSDGPRAPRNVVVRDTGSAVRTLVWDPIPDAASYVVALRYPGSMRYDQYFETSDTSINSEIFTSSVLAGVAIAGRSIDGLVGPLSNEYPILR